MDEAEIMNDENRPRRSSRIALMEVNETVLTDENPNKTSSPDEMVIVQRGPRKKPITWSPLEYDKIVLGVNREKTPEPVVTPMNPKIRRRLVLTPDSSQELGEVIAKKLRSVRSFERCTR